MRNRPFNNKAARHAARRKRLLLIAAGVLVVLAAVAGVLWATDNLPFSGNSKREPAHTANSETKGEPSQQNNKQTQTDPQTENTTGSSENKSQTGSTDNNPPANADLKAPTGNFVNNHRPSLSDSSTMQSSCVTTPGATCQIIFTKDDVTKTLPSQKTDAGGGTYWTWTLQSAGLTEGTWRIQAKATLGSQTETADDAINLEVSS